MNILSGVQVQCPGKAEPDSMDGEYYISSMPVRDLILDIRGDCARGGKRASRGLVYRDFITIGLLLKSMLAGGNSGIMASPSFRIIGYTFRNPMLKSGDCRYSIIGARIWFGIREIPGSGWNISATKATTCGPWRTRRSLIRNRRMVKIGMIDRDAVLDWTVIRMAKAYPAYFGLFDRLNTIRSFTDKIENLFLIGRNGMHKYNNQDHSMLTAMTAVDKIMRGIKSERKHLGGECRRRVP